MWEADHRDTDLLTPGKKETEEYMLIITGYIWQVNKGKSLAWEKISSSTSIYKRAQSINTLSFLGLEKSTYSKP